MIMYPLIGLIPPHLCVCPNPRHGSPRTRWMILYPIVIFHILILTFHSEIYFKMLARQLDQQIHNKLHEIHSLVDQTPCSYVRLKQERTSSRIGHGRVTHSYLLNNEERLECFPCDSNSNTLSSLKNILLDCGRCC